MSRIAEPFFVGLAAVMLGPTGPDRAYLRFPADKAQPMGAAVVLNKDSGGVHVIGTDGPTPDAKIHSRTLLGPYWTLEDLKPYFAHVAEGFGFERMVWGSDWPVCTLGGGLSTWIGATQALLSGVSLEDKRRVFSENARRLWKIAPKA